MDEITCRWKTAGSERCGRSDLMANMEPWYTGRSGGAEPGENDRGLSGTAEGDRRVIPNGQAAGPQRGDAEIYAFMDAAQRSKEAGGKPMKLGRPYRFCDTRINAASRVYTALRTSSSIARLAPAPLRVETA